MKLDGFIESLRRHDASLALGVLELFRRADPEGRLDRGAWIAGIRSAHGREKAIEARALGSEGDDSPGDGRYLEDHILARLAADGIAHGEPQGPGWELVRVQPEIWAAFVTDRAEATAALERALDPVLHDGRREAGAAVPGQGSTLSTQGLVKAYRKRRVVADVDLSVSQGEIVGLLGPNGAGKTTTFYMIVGLISPDVGRVFLDGDDLTGVPMYRRARRGIGYLAQEPSVFRKLTVEENIMAILETLGLSRSERKARLESLLDELGLRHLRKAKAYSLSGGERRRLEITRALVSRPKFMLLDEPFAGIDPIAVNDIQQIVADLRLRGIGVVITDHNVEQTLDIVDRAYIMYDGRVRVSGTVAELVWNDEVAEIYFGPTLTARMRARYGRPEAAE
jgi:lipopolysaccharide export system ATP-binding protein